ETREAAFREAAAVDLPIVVHAEEEEILVRAAQERSPTSYAEHSRLRPREAAIVAVEKAIRFAERYGTRLHILHLSTREEAMLVASAKERGIRITAEVTPHHLFLSEEDYEEYGSFVVCNPPIRETADCEALWKGLLDGTIDCIGTDH